MELYIPPFQQPPTRNYKNGRIMKGYIPKNKGKKWSDYNVPEESRRKILANLTNEGRIKGSLANRKLNSQKIVGIKARKFVGSYESAAEAARILQSAGIRVSATNIRHCCKGKRPSAGGVKWYYEANFEEWQKEIKDEKQQ